MERRKEEKILWIDSANMLSGTTNNFYYDIGNILYNGNYKKLSVQLIDCLISKNYDKFAVGSGVIIETPIAFFSVFIKIYINFNVASNILNNNNSYGLLMGIIPGDNACVKIATSNILTYYEFSNLGSSDINDNKIKYYLKDVPNGIINININIIGNSNSLNVDNYVDGLLVDAFGNPPSNVLLYLKFTYEF